MTKQEIESLQCIVDQIGARLDALMNFVVAIEVKKAKPSARKSKPKAKSAKH